jgi:hypothetical protein
MFVPAYAYFQLKVGASITSLSLAEGKEVWRDDQTMSWLPRAVGLGGIPLLLYGARRFSAGGTRTGLFVLALTSLVFAFLSLRLGQRGPSVAFLLAMASILHRLRWRIPPWIIFAGGLVTITASNWLGDIRNRQESEVSLATRLTPGKALVRMEEDRGRLTAAAVVLDTYPNRQDYLKGESYVAFAAILIPRWVWPEKNEALRMRDNAIVYELTGASIPVPFQFALYANFGWVGLVVGMMLWGIFHRGLFTWLEQNPRDPNVVLLYTVIMLYFEPTMLAIGFSIGAVIPMWLALRFIGRRPAAGATSPAAAPSIA